MKMRIMIAVLTCVLGGSSVPAYADIKIGHDTDILGLNLTMTRDQAKKYVSDHFSGASIVDLPVQMGTDVFKKSTVSGFVADITTKEENSANKDKTQQINDYVDKTKKYLGDSPLDRPISYAGDFGSDHVMILLNPNDNATDIFGISRYKKFSKSSFPVEKTLFTSLVEKYGQPSRSNGTRYTWTASGVLARPHTPNHECFKDFNDYFLYETDPDLIFSGNAITRGLQIGQISDSFVNIINHLDVFDRSKCETVLQIVLTLSNDGTYVTGMTETLIDLTQAQSKLKEFADDFWHRANAAKQEKLNRDSQNKPKL